MIKLCRKEIEYLKIHREVRDLLLARRLWEAYEKDTEMIGAIRSLIRAGVEHLTERILPDFAGAEIQKFLNDECDGLDIWEGKKQTVAMVKDLGNKQPSWWNLGKCGGFLRLYGTAIEWFRNHLDDGIRPFEEDKRRDGKPTPVSERVQAWEAESRKIRRTPALQGQPWDSTLRSELDFLENGRDQWRKKVAKKGGQYTGDPFNKKKFRLRDSVKGRSVPKEYRGIVICPYDPIWHTGITLFKLKQESTIRKIDALFGLPEGADISGTTTDHAYGIFYCLYSLEQKAKAGSIPQSTVDRVNKRLPLVLLTPLIQMIAEYHHSMLESATALSLNDLIDYKIGFYTSLLPLEWDSNTRTTTQWRSNLDITNKVRRLLQESEAAATHMVVFEGANHDHSLAGYALDYSDAEEVKKFKKMASLGVDEYFNFANLPAQVRRNDVQNLLKRHKLKI